MAEPYFKRQIHQSPRDAALSLSKRILEQTGNAIRQKERSVWAVSGGSSIHLLYEALRRNDTTFREYSKHLTVIWVDERFVPHDDKHSNFGNAHAAFWQYFDEVHLIPVPYQKNVIKAAEKYDQTLKEYGIEAGTVDITILGMGTDGHTASLFPWNKALGEKNRDVVDVTDPSVEHPRISLTFPFINASASIYLFMYGGEKSKTLLKAELTKDRNRFPVLSIDQRKTEVYSDQHLKDAQMNPDGSLG